MQGEEFILYADDINLLIQQEEETSTNIRLANYEKATKSRQVEIKWGKVKFLAKGKEKALRENTPRPFNQIKQTNA